MSRLEPPQTPSTSAWVWGLRALAGALALLVSVAFAAPAVAAPAFDALYPTPNLSQGCGVGISSDTICQTDNAEVSYYMDSSGDYMLESGDRAEVIAARGQYNQTDLNVNYDDSPTFEGSGETDLIFQEGSAGLPDGLVGVTWCNDAVSGIACDQHYVRMRGDGIINEKLAAHEHGHAVGLVHGNRAGPAQSMCNLTMGVMRQPLNCYSNASIGSHMIANINWVY